MRRTAVVVILAVLAASACGGGEVEIDTTLADEGPVETTGTTGDGSEASTSTEASTGTAAPATTKEIQLYSGDAGREVPANIGDTILVRLPEDDPAAGPWVLVRPPDPLILGIGEVFVWTPSETGAEVPYAEFTFFVLGSGSTTIELRQGAPSPDTPTLEFPIEAYP